jgi:crotonobetainyl-CoA:carnitine CoA-transferase CaiB-like acyl-CoA transferase
VELPTSIAPPSAPITTVAPIEFDPAREVRSLLATVGLDAELAASVRIEGEDPVVDSVVRLGGAAAVAMAARSAAVAGIWRHRGGGDQDITVRLGQAIHSFSPSFHRAYLCLNGYPVSYEDPGNAYVLRAYQTGDGRWVCVSNSTRRLQDRVAAVLDCRSSTDAVARAVAHWSAQDLEQAIQDAGGACAFARTREEWAAEEQRQTVMATPVVELARIGDADPEPLGPAGRPLAGVRGLGMAHIIAGGHLGSVLAEQGADVLNLWPPDAVESRLFLAQAHQGMRSAWLDTETAEDRATLRVLLGGADVFFSNRRARHLDRLGLGAEEVAALRPGIVHVTLSAFGQAGPWADWGGYDPHAQYVAGYSVLEGGDGPPRLAPTIVLNDFLSGWLAALGVLAALQRRAIEGGSWQVRVNLTRCQEWCLSLGLLDVDPDCPVGDRRLLEPTLRVEQTPLGRFQYIPSQVEMSATPPRFAWPLLPMGSSEPRWEQPGARGSRASTGADVARAQ